MRLPKFLWFVIVLFTVLQTQAQTSVPRKSFSRNSFWTETIVNGSIHKKWKWQLDYQYRRMSDASDVNGGSGNMFKNAYQHVYRPWVHYQMNDNIRFSLSPVGFWESFTPSTENNIHVRQLQPEFRICPQITLTNKMGRVTLDQRYRFEKRYIGTKVVDESSEFHYDRGLDFPMSGKRGRLRYFVRATIPLGKHQKIENNTFYIITWNEIFLGLGEQTATEKIWDQNRTFCLLGYKPKMKFPMRFEVGYGLQYANRFSGTGTSVSNRMEQNNILQLYVIVEDFNRLFKSDN